MFTSGWLVTDCWVCGAEFGRVYENYAISSCSCCGAPATDPLPQGAIDALNAIIRGEEKEAVAV